jgi:hypothetical protein
VISYIKNNPIKFVFGWVLIIILSFNYFGFCFSQFRFLSDKEKINIAVTDILVGYPKRGYVHEQLNTKNGVPQWNTVNTWPENTISYRNIDEFFELNSSCCQVTTNYIAIGGDGDTVGCLNRLTGFKSSIISIRYLLRYRDNYGTIQSKLIEIFPGISNCGELVWELG